MSWCNRILHRKLCHSFKHAKIRGISHDIFASDGNPLPPNPADADVSTLLQDELVSGFTGKPKIDPDDTNVLLFPGQGSQVVGMADKLLEFPNVKEMFAAASEILNFDLLGYCQNGPHSELDRTVHCQPAVMVTSLAGVEKIQATNPDVLEHCYAAAGYSVGEFAALVFSGALSFEDAISLVGVRSRAMQRASDSASSKMITAVGSGKAKFKQACVEAQSFCKLNHQMESPVCAISAFLCPNTVTIAGHTEAINFIHEHARRFGIRRITPIPVSGAFHTNLMYEASQDLREALKKVNVQEPIINIYSNVTGKKYGGVRSIKENLPKQVTRPVLWEQTIHSLLRRPNNINMPTLYDAGPGTQLGPLIKHCNGKAWKNYVPISKVIVEE